MATSGVPQDLKSDLQGKHLHVIAEAMALGGLTIYYNVGEECLKTNTPSDYKERPLEKGWWSLHQIDGCF